MANSSSLAAAVLLFLAGVISVHSNPGNGDMIEQFCEKSAKMDPNIKSSFCKAALDSALERNHRPRPTSAMALAVLAVKAAGANATATRSVIQKMLAGGGGGSVRSLLEECLEHYSNAVYRCKQCSQALKEKRMDDARAMMSAAMDWPGTCDDGFEDLKKENPLKTYDAYFFEMTAIALNALSS